MKTIFIFLSVTFSLFMGCGETENSVVTPRHLETDRSGPQEIKPQLIPPPEIDIERYPKGWVHLTDADVTELLELPLPKRWWKTRDEGLREKYGHADLLKQHGDIPAVRFIIEAQRNSPWRPAITLKFFECLYFLFPNEQNKRVLENVRANLPKDVPLIVNLPPKTGSNSIS